tara:strand:- start:925 stop:2688 length:1764 start_codon:yes stop_codon:yes gene_type:complete
MPPMISHPLLVDNEVDARAYQLEATNATLASSTLLVLPTAMGKTAVQWMVIAETLRTKEGMALLLAPTNALVDQQHRGLERVMNLQNGETIARMTGAIPPKKRMGSWEEHRIVVATPQVVRNDAINDILDLSKISVLVVDEAHRATGNAAVAQIGDMLKKANPEATILGATASPGWNESSVEEVCKRLHLEGIHVRGSDEPMLKPYASSLDIEEIRVPVPKELRDLSAPLEVWLEAIISRERRLGHYIRSGITSMGGLNEAMKRVQAAIAREERIAYRSAGDLGVAIRLYNLSNLLVCQGVAASREAIRRMHIRLKSKQKGDRKLKEFLEDPRIRNLESTLEDMDEIHSKVSFTRRVIRQEISRNPEGRMIIFANYRDTVAAIVSFIEDIPGVNPTPFVGQANQNKDGMSHSEQIERLNAFRSGEYNVLVATSVGEEGLDIPRADLVLFYEPVGSEIRTIQRRGRTGRHDRGSVYVLIAQDTRDEGATAAAAKREQRMLIAIRRVKNKRNSFNPDLELLSSFSIIDGDNKINAKEFVESERKRLREELEEVDETPVMELETTEEEQHPEIPPQRRRRRGQSGIEEWY